MKKIFIIVIILLIVFQTNIGVFAVNGNSTDNKANTTQDTKAALYPFSKNGKWGYMDVKGNINVKPRYDNAFHFSDGLGLVELKGKWGYIDASGEIAIPIKYDYGTSFDNGNAAVSRYNDDKDEKTFYWIKPNGKHFFKLIDTEDALAKPKPFSEDLAVIEEDGGYEPSYKYINIKGNLAINMKFGQAYSFSEGLAAVFDSLGKYGYGYLFVDKKGAQAIAKKFDDARSFSEGLALVKVGNKWGYIDKNGKFKIQATYQDARSFSDGIVAVMQNGKWGFIDKDNKFIIKPQYENADDCVNGLIMVKDSKGEFLYYIDKNNKKIEPKI